MPERRANLRFSQTGHYPEIQVQASEGREALRTAGLETGATILGDLREMRANLCSGFPAPFFPAGVLEPGICTREGAAGAACPMAASCCARAAASRSTGMPAGHNHRSVVAGSSDSRVMRNRKG